MQLTFGQGQYKYEVCPVVELVQENLCMLMMQTCKPPFGGVPSVQA